MSDYTLLVEEPNNAYEIEIGETPYSLTVEPRTNIVLEVSGGQGPTGPTGPAGVGVPTGGTTGQVLKKNSNADYDTEWAEDEAGTSAVWGAITGTLSNQTDLQSALNAKEDDITPGTTSQYWRGDKTFQTLDKNAVGLGNVDNTSDLNKPISTATQAALDAKIDLVTYTQYGGL